MKVKDIAVKIKGLSKAEFDQLKKELGGGYVLTNSETADGEGDPNPNPTPGTGDNGNDTHPKPPVP